MAKVYINGTFFPENEARVSVFDRGYLYGDGVFETLRAYSGQIFRIEAHLNRLFESLGRISLPVPWDSGFLTQLLMECLSVNQCPDAVLRLSISRGIGPPGLDPDLCGKPTLIVLTRPFHGYSDTRYAEGVPVTVVATRKNLPEALHPTIKSSNFLNNILAKIEAKEAGAEEGILLNHQGYLTEGTVSNLFFVREGLLCTPSVDSGILLGVSRAVVIDIARSQHIPIREGLFTPEELDSAQEVFLTNTTYEVMPVTRLDQRALPVGPITRQIRKAFREKVQKG